MDLPDLLRHATEQPAQAIALYKTWIARHAGHPAAAL
jgi:hypothetical protein